MRKTHKTHKSQAVWNALSRKCRRYAADVRRTRHRDRLVLRLGELTYWEHMGVPCLDTSVDRLVAQITELTPGEGPSDETCPAPAALQRSVGAEDIPPRAAL